MLQNKGPLVLAESSIQKWILSDRGPAWGVAQDLILDSNAVQQELAGLLWSFSPSAPQHVAVRTLCWQCAAVRSLLPLCWK